MDFLSLKLLAEVSRYWPILYRFCYVSNMGFVGRGLLILDVSTCWRKACGTVPAHPCLSPQCFQDWVSQFLPSPLPVSITEQVNINLSVHSNFRVCSSRRNYGKLEGTQHCYKSATYFSPLSDQLFKHTKQQKITSCIGLCSSSPVSSIGVKVVTGHGAGQSLKATFKSRALRVLLIYFLYVYSGQNWTFCCFEIVLIIMVIQMYEWRAAWVVSSN